MRPQFDVLRACFLLLAIVILSQIATTFFGALTCFYLFIVGTASPGACSTFGQQTREIWAEILAAVLALLLASRGEPPPPPPEGKPDASTPKASD